MMTTRRHLEAVAKENTVPVRHPFEGYTEERKPVAATSSWRDFSEEPEVSFLAADAVVGFSDYPVDSLTYRWPRSVHTEIVSVTKDNREYLATPRDLRPSFAARIIGATKELLHLDLRTAPLKHQVFQVNLNYALGPYVVVDGEWCTWREDEVLGVVVKREPWSLLGTGNTLDDAIVDFRREASKLAAVMQHDSLDDLTREARRMQDFVLRYLPEDG